MGLIGFRCDGGIAVGAGHVARCLSLARAFTAGGDDVVFCGDYDGLASDLLADAGMARVGGLEIPTDVDAVIVDSYDVDASQLADALPSVPLAAIVDLPDASPGRGVTVLTYHAVDTTADLAGPNYALVDPRFVAARGERGFASALVTFGGSAAGAAAARIAAGIASDARLAVVEPAVGLVDVVGAIDVALSGAGLTPYELACAGVPSVIVAIVENQAPVAAGLSRAGAVIAVSATAGLDSKELAAALERLREPELRAALTAAGPAVVDGYGAARARDALTATFAGRPPSRVLRYRPVTAADADLLLQWRNDRETLAASRAQQPVSAREHADWVSLVIADRARSLFVVEDDTGPAATLRFDGGTAEAEISVTVAPERRGEGIASRILREGSELHLAAHLSVETVVAELRPDNKRSIAACERAGFTPAGEGSTPGLLRLSLDREALRRTSTIYP